MAYTLLYNKNYKVKRKPYKKLFSTILFFILLASTLVWLTREFGTNLRKGKTYASPLISASSLTTTPTKQSTTISEMQTIVEKATEDSKTKFGIVIEDIKKGEVYLKEAHLVFNSASLYKLWVMATVYQQIEKGELSEDEVLSESVSLLNSTFNIDPDSAEQTEGTTTGSVKSLLERMITISDNYSAMLLSKKVGVSTITSFLTKHFFKDSSMGSQNTMPTTTAFDIALFLEKLYHGELNNTENTDKMLALLQRQKKNNKLPKYLPTDTLVAHKTGELGTATHDGGIVYSPKGSYIIVVFAESSSPGKAEEEIAQLSKSIYAYFTK